MAFREDLVDERVLRIFGIRESVFEAEELKVIHALVDYVERGHEKRRPPEHRGFLLPGKDPEIILATACILVVVMIVLIAIVITGKIIWSGDEVRKGQSRMPDLASYGMQPAPDRRFQLMD